MREAAILPQFGMLVQFLLSVADMHGDLDENVVITITSTLLPAS